MSKIAIYARQSVDRPDSISIENQIEHCKYEAKGQAYLLFTDRGFSGKDTDRPEFQKMMDAVRKGEINRVICYKLDRCSRSILDFANMMDEFQKYHVEFISSTEKFDTSTPIGRAMLNICIVFAQLERETIQQRVSDAYHARSKQGFYMGGRVPFGFRLQAHIIDGKKTAHYLQDKKEAEVIKEIFDLYQKPLATMGDVARELTARKIVNPQRKDGTWDRNRINAILKNPIYVRADRSVYRFFTEEGVVIHSEPELFQGTNGCYLYNETGNPAQTMHMVIAPHEGIIPAALWLQCRKKSICNSKNKGRVSGKNSWLTGKMKCHKCGYALIIRKSNTKTGRYFVCSRHLNSPNGCEGVGGIPADLLEDAITGQITDKLKILQHWDSQNTTDILEITRKINASQQEIDALMTQMKDANDTLLKYIRDRVTMVDLEISKLMRQHDKLIMKRNCDHQAITKDFSMIWDQLNSNDKYMITDAMIRRIEATKTDIYIHWRF